MADRIDITISIRDFHPSQKACRSRLVVCALFANDTDNEDNWKKIGVSVPVPIQREIFFVEPFPYHYVFEKTQLIKMTVCAYTTHGQQNYPHDEGLAVCIFKVDELIGSFGLQLCKPLLETCTASSVLQLGPSRQSSSVGLGSVFVNATLPIKKQPVLIQLQGRNLERKDLLWDETAVFFRIYRVEEASVSDADDERILLYESEALKNHSHPCWKEFALDVAEVADDRNRLLETVVHYRDVDGKEGYIGTCLFTYAKMKYGAGPDNSYKVINEEKKRAKKSYENSGILELVKFNDVSFYSFLDYVVSGTQLHYEIYVDFSEERIKQTTAERNRYETLLQMGIRGVGTVLRDYTPNRLFPAYGFAARIPPLAQESNEFILNFSPDPICRGLDGVVDAYKKAQTLVAPMDTARYTKILSGMIKQAQASGSRGMHYHVSTVFTRGGPIDDFKESLSLLSSSVPTLPLTVVFVGVGVGDFSYVQKLVKKAKEAQSRVCVEFVELMKIVDLTLSIPANRILIAQNVLKCVPQQMLAYMHANLIAAKPPIQMCRSPLFHSSFLIPDRPSQFAMDDETAIIDSVLERGRKGSMSGNATSNQLSPRIPNGGRRGSEGQFLHVNPDALREQLGMLSARLPERSRSVLNTSREQFLLRRREREAERERLKGIHVTPPMLVQ